MTQPPPPPWGQPGTPDPANPGASVPPAAPGQPPQPAAGYGYPPGGPGQPGQYGGQYGPPRKNTGLIIAIIVIGLVVLLGAGSFLLYALLKDDDSSKSDKSDTKVLKPSGEPYTVQLPKGFTETIATDDQPALTLNLTKAKNNEDNQIQIGIVEEHQGKDIDELEDEARDRADSLEAVADASTGVEITEIAGADAVQLTATYEDTSEDITRSLRTYLIDGPGNDTVAILCQWTDKYADELEEGCSDVVDSLELT